MASPEKEHWAHSVAPFEERDALKASRPCSRQASCFAEPARAAAPPPAGRHAGAYRGRRGREGKIAALLPGSILPPLRESSRKASRRSIRGIAVARSERSGAERIFPAHRPGSRPRPHQTPADVVHFPPTRGIFVAWKTDRACSRRSFPQGRRAALCGGGSRCGRHARQRSAFRSAGSATTPTLVQARGRAEELRRPARSEMGRGPASSRAHPSYSGTIPDPRPMRCRRRLGWSFLREARRAARDAGAVGPAIRRRSSRLGEARRAG